MEPWLSSPSRSLHCKQLTPALLTPKVPNAEWLRHRICSSELGVMALAQTYSSHVYMKQTVFIGLKGAHNTHVSRWVSRKIKISYAMLQSNLDSSEHCAFFSSRDKERAVASALTHKITNRRTDTHTVARSLEHTPFTLFQLPGWGKLWGRTECLELSFYFISQ